MKWEEVRTIYPNKFVLLKSLEAHIEENKKCIDDVAVVRALDDEEASNILIRCKGDNFVFHTSKEELSMNIVQMPVLRGAIR